MAWNDLIASVKEEYRELWGTRISALSGLGQTRFTYAEVAEAWGTSKGNTSTRLNKWADEWPDLVRIDKSNEPYEVVFNFDIEEDPTDRLPIPLFLTEKAYNNILERVPDSMREYTVSFRRLAWQKNCQRGRIDVELLDINLPVMKAIFRLDNGFVVNSPRWTVI